MSEKYEPPFTMNDAIVDSIVAIGQTTGRILAQDSLSANPRLRRENRIKTIQSSLAIENNTLTIEQVTAVLDGKRVLAPPKDIREVQNAYEAYEALSSMDPYSMDDLLRSHRFMMAGLTEEAGRFRSKNVGVYDGDRLVHAGTPAHYVAEVMQELFSWLRSSSMHPLVKSCVFHYEFEFIHPFSDGNGRTGRLWHSLILQKWEPVFAWLPVESMVGEHQQEYYDALAVADSAGDSSVFVEFMLRMIGNTLNEAVSERGDVGTNVGINVGRNPSKPDEGILAIMREEPSVTMASLASTLGISKRQVERIVASLKKSGRIERIGANKNGRWTVRD
ncbi:Fic family protein [Eggerthella sinensis]|uniref:Fic family protein n=1 Tax=Eggerthella sinensis TaxID=242230 RepID=UPI0022E64067|nr:Fic family protein [Eggerthella sinensis]